MHKLKKYVPVLVLVALVVYMANPGCGRDGVDVVHMQAVTEADFAVAVEEADEWVLVDFWATWCPPCRALLPVLDEVAPDYAGRVKFVKVDVDENPELAARFGVQSIPHVHLFRDGKPVDGFLGFRNHNQIRTWLDERIKDAS